MAQSKKEMIVALLQDLVRQIQALDETEIDDAIAGKVKLQVRIEDGKRPPRTTRTKSDGAELHELGQALRTLGTREEGEKLLDEKVPSKDEMLRLARILDLPVQKSDTVEQLRVRLIESTIGFRLRSAAIQGTQATPSHGSVDDK